MATFADINFYTGIQRGASKGGEQGRLISRNGEYILLFLLKAQSN